MKKNLRAVFSPLLNIFEKSKGPYVYKPMSRIILIIMGILFSGLASAVIYSIVHNDAYRYFLPAFIFSVVAVVCIIIGSLGNERAVAKIWGNK